MSSPAAVATGERRLTLFVRGQGGELLICHREGNAWSEARSLGIPLARTGDARSPTVPIDWPVAACATRPEEIHLLARGAEGELVHGTLRGEEWDGFECIGSPANWVGGIGVPMGLASAPSARLSLWEVRVPALRERRVDVLEWIEPLRRRWIERRPAAAVRAQGPVRSALTPDFI